MGAKPQKVVPEKQFVAWAQTGAEPLFIGNVPEGTPPSDVDISGSGLPHWSRVSVTSIDEYFHEKLRYFFAIHFQEDHK